jgi:cysteine desulfurase/selenocysteine lyase
MKKNVYMDAAASWLKSQSVIESEVDFLSNHYANAGRGVCERAGAVDVMVENARRKVADFIGAGPKNIVWTSGATDGLNRIANIISSQPEYNAQSVVAVSDLDHHSARMPWEALKRAGKIGQMLVCDLDENNNIKIDSIPFVDILIITAMSNVLGMGQDVGAIIRVARDKNPNVITIVDASQYVAHKKIDVKKWDCDFLVFSGHKIGADTGVGVMYIRDVDKYYPDKFGGGMVNKIIGDSNWILNNAPQKFEAGTLPLTQIIGMSHAIDELQKWSGGTDLIHYMYDELSKIDKIKILSMRDACMLTFVVDGMHPLDFGALMGANDICIRVGNMCASWIHQKLGINGSIRLSVGPWNTMTDAEYVVETIRKLVK